MAWIDYTPNRASPKRSGKTTSSYTLHKDPMSQLYVYAHLCAWGAIQVPLSRAKQLFNYPEAGTDKGNANVETFRTNAMIHTRKHGPDWLNLGVRTMVNGDQDEIVFKIQRNQHLPEWREFLMSIDMKMSDAKAKVEQLGFRLVGGKVIDGIEGEAQEEEPEDNLVQDFADVDDDDGDPEEPPDAAEDPEGYARIKLTDDWFASASRDALQAECRLLGLKIRGKKDEVAERLRNYRYEMEGE